MNLNEIFLNAELLPHDYKSAIIWILIGLATAVGTIWRLYISAINKVNENYQNQLVESKKIMDERILEKDKQIEELNVKVEKIQAVKEKLLFEMQMSFKEVAKSLDDILQYLRNEK